LYNKASARQRIYSVIDRARATDTVHRTCRHSMNYETLQTTNYSAKLSEYHIMSYTHYYHHPQHHGTIISDTAPTH